MQGDVENVDVLIVGAGPVGLITAFQLAKFGGVSVRIVEKHAKSEQDSYGRAITLFPRTAEMLDQLGLADELLQHCFACRNTVTYNAEGEEVDGRGWSFMKHMKDTTFDFSLVLRQKFQEEIFRNALRQHDVHVSAPIELITASVDTNIPTGNHKVTAVLLNHRSGATEIVKCKYLIGCDGGRSSVRRIFNITFEGSISEDKWVRIDGQVKTNLPKPRSYCSIESPTHGNVLWAALDHGSTRIGYAFTADRANGYEEFDEAAAVKEAIAAVKPFQLEFEHVDWWTIYTVGQRIAKSFFVEGCIFLAGDACHTHSSAAAQGMNTGIHDAVNLAWKLSLVLRRYARPDLLETYHMERFQNIAKLIEYDKDISQLMSNHLPEKWRNDPDADVNVILAKILEEVGTFTSGLGISYEVRKDNPINVEGPFCGNHSLVKPGMRGPDITLLRPGTFEPTRLIRELPNTSRFSVLIFAAERQPPIPKVLYDDITCSLALERPVLMSHLRFVTILPKPMSSPYEVLGCEPIGRAYFDEKDGAAYRRYGIESPRGAIVVLRPDGWIGTMIELGDRAAWELESYFDKILLYRSV
ncbi:3-propionate hydroxylase [Daldinia caldariorum]|uniref:3-propionate hydroxylase n=1 Tax=Daldinia caldariorum TaxID=326644 RepID=UPI00200853C8|nr:3-propionate hydroxylase [Daldinia caldariorum]KAI1464217.1 3-propionate hydroxylase [Daldinia caldariorum]